VDVPDYSGNIGNTLGRFGVLKVTVRSGPLRFRAARKMVEIDVAVGVVPTDAYLSVHQDSNSQEIGDVPNQDCRTPLPGESPIVGTRSDRLACLERSGARNRS
jgi:hypothetical protein